MRSNLSSVIAVAAATLVLACAGQTADVATPMEAAEPSADEAEAAMDQAGAVMDQPEAVMEVDPTPEPASPENNVLLAEWSGPYGGVPAFDEMDLRVFTYWGIWSGNRSTPEFREIQQEMAPKLSEFFSKITQNEALFERVKAVYESDEMKSLRPDEQRLVWLTYDGFARNGATLEGEAKERYAAINQRLAEIHTKFGNNVLADEEGYVLYITEEQLAACRTRSSRPRRPRPPSASTRASTPSPTPVPRWIRS